MSQLKPLHTLETDHDTAITGTIRRLSRLGLVVRRSFDLQAAKAVHGATLCPHHGGMQCDCQIVFFQVYGEGGPPVTLVVDSRDGRTTLAILEAPPDESGSLTARQIAAAFTPPLPDSFV